MKVFITGGSSGIGAELTKIYLSRGWEVGICGRHKKKLSQNFNKEEISKVKFYEVNVANRSALNKAVTDFVGPDPLELMIANAGIPMGKKLRLPDWDKAHQITDINIKGVLNSFEAALEHMQPIKKGHLVAISSVAGLNGLPGTGMYSASKAAIRILCESLAIDLEGEGIKVTSVLPGFVKTPLTDINPHPMPFIIEAPKAARKIVSAIDKNKKTVCFPWQMCMITKLLSFLPRSWFYGVMKLKSFNFSRND